MTTPAASSATDTHAAAAAASAAAPDSSESVSFSRRWAWGSNGSGVLGLGHADDLFTPTQATIIHAQKVADGDATTALTAVAASEKSDGESDTVATSLIAATLSSPIRFTRMSCGGCHTLAVDELGRVWSWGDNSRGQLGQGLSAAALASDSALQTSPALIPSLAARRCSWVSAGWSHSACILDSIAAADNAGSTLFTFGCNARSQLGLGTASSSKQLPRLDQPTEVVALRGPGVAQVACGGRHTLVLTNEGRVCAFGDNAHGQLGVGDLQSKAQPTTVKAFTAEAAASADEPLLCSTVCAGWRHSLFVSLDRKSIHAAGSNSLGELGIGIGAGESSSSSSSSASARSSTKFSRPVPVRLPDAFNSSSSSIRRVSCGWSHNIVLSSSGELFGWGRADFGALATKPTGTDAAAGVNAGEGGGGGSKSSKSVPLPVSISLPASLAAEPSLALDVACGSEHTVLLTATDVFVCGWNEHGNLGLGHNRDRNDEDTFAFTPIPQLHLDEPIPRRVVTGGAAVMILEP